LLNVLLSSAGLSMREDAEREPAKADPKQRPRRPRAPSTNG